MSEQQPEEIQNGIYFNMPDVQYHAIDALSASGIKKMMVSPLTFWTETYDPSYIRRESLPMTKGKAYHKRILEGKEAFENSYVPRLSKEDHPNALDTQAELKDYCKSRDLKVSGTKPELVGRILEVEPEMGENIFSLMMDKFNTEHSHQEHLHKSDFNEVEKAALILEQSELAMHFTSGMPEVSIIWTDELTGIKCKSRLDYLRHDLIPDLKTFSNSKRKSVETCVAQAIAYERYNIQAVFYMQAIEALKKMVKAKSFYCDRSDMDDFLKLVCENDQEFVFVFQESGQVNNCLARKFTKTTHGRPNAFWGASEDRIFDVKQYYSDFMQSHGKDHAWVVPQKTEYFDDADFPIFMIEG